MLIRQIYIMELPYRELKEPPNQYLCLKVLKRRNRRGVKQLLMCLKGKDGQLFASWIDQTLTPQCGSLLSHILQRRQQSYQINQNERRAFNPTPKSTQNSKKVRQNRLDYCQPNVAFKTKSIFKHSPTRITRSRNENPVRRQEKGSYPRDNIYQTALNSLQGENILINGCVQNDNRAGVQTQRMKGEEIKRIANSVPKGYQLLELSVNLETYLSKQQRELANRPKANDLTFQVAEQKPEQKELLTPSKREADLSKYHSNEYLSQGESGHKQRMNSGREVFQYDQQEEGEKLLKNQDKPYQRNSFPVPNGASLSQSDQLDNHTPFNSKGGYKSSIKMNKREGQLKYCGRASYSSGRQQSLISLHPSDAFPESSEWVDVNEQQKKGQQQFEEGGLCNEGEQELSSLSAQRRYKQEPLLVAPNRSIQRFLSLGTDHFQHQQPQSNSQAAEHQQDIHQEVVVQPASSPNQADNLFLGVQKYQQAGQQLNPLEMKESVQRHKTEQKYFSYVPRLLSSSPSNCDFECKRRAVDQGLLSWSRIADGVRLEVVSILGECELEGIRYLWVLFWDSGALIQKFVQVQHFEQFYGLSGLIEGARVVIKIEIE